jgi:DNA end-binding protein Ku
MDNRSTIRGANLSFGLINMPVALTKAHGREIVSLKMLHKTCGVQIKKTNFCPECNVIVGTDEIGKGYQVSKNKIMMLDEGKLAAFVVQRDSQITLRKFVPRQQVEQVLIEKLYYLKAHETLHGPYDLLAAGLTKSKKAAIGKAALWGREAPVAVWPEGNSLVLAILFCADEVFPPLSYPKPKLDATELKFAVQYMEMMGGDLEPQDLVSESRQRTMEYINTVIGGDDVTVPEAAAEPAPTINLMEVLKEMVK